MIFNFKTIRLFIAVLLLLFAAEARADGPKKICVLPFEVYALSGSAELQASVYNSLLTEFGREKKVEVKTAGGFEPGSPAPNPQEAAAAGKALGADYVVTGSIMQFGEALNIDAQIIDVAEGKILPAVSIQGKEAAALAAALKREILDRAGLLDKIARVEIAGNRKIGADAIRQKLKSKPGNPLDEEDISDDIKTIFKMGYFLDVSADVATEAAGKVLTF
ncbi:MAG: hypothetical protein KBE00_10860, partial [Syntrophaceae bacterium]|nr:hypothetical protein [Syntrophaceae bacterium]